MLFICLTGSRAGGGGDEHVEVLSGSGADGEAQEQALQRDSLCWSSEGEVVSPEGC